MRISEKTRLYLASRVGKTVKREDYTVKLTTPEAVTYSVGDKRLTLTSEFFQKEGSFWFFGAYLGIYVEDPLRWDNEDDGMPLEEATLTMSRVTSALDQLRCKYKFIPA